jgi:hypothetical protein
VESVYFWLGSANKKNLITAILKKTNWILTAVFGDTGIQAPANPHQTSFGVLLKIEKEKMGRGYYYNYCCRICSNRCA